VAAVQQAAGNDLQQYKTNWHCHPDADLCANVLVMTMTQRNYDYDVTIRRAVDGDTYVMIFDLSAYWRENYQSGDLSVVGPELLLPVDLGFGVIASGFLPTTFVTKVRLIGANTPEEQGETRRQGEESTAYAERWFRRYSKTRARTHKTKSGWTKGGKFGRYLVDVFGTDELRNQSNLAQELVSKKLAVKM